MLRLVVATAFCSLLTQSVLAAPVSQLELDLTIRSSNMLYTTKLMSFETRLISGTGNATSEKKMKCRNESIYVINMGQKLFKDGWKPELAVDRDSRGLGMKMMSCRDSNHEVLGWFPTERDIDYDVSDQLLDDDYNPARLPLLIRLTSLDGDISYFSCSNRLQKIPTGETASYKEHSLRQNCAPISSLPARSTGQPDFVSNPGPYSAVAGYRPWTLPGRRLLSSTLR